MLILWIILTIAAVIVGWLVFWTLVSFLVGKSAYHKQFIAGKIPENAPDGFYKGTAHILFDKQTPWLGKSFDRSNRLGFNIFTPVGAKILKITAPFYKRYSVNEEGNTLAFYFQTRTEPGIKDKDLDVIKLDYDSTENPFRIRLILDEIVETAPQEYIGKIHLKVFPGFFCTIGYFSLRK